MEFASGLGGSYSIHEGGLDYHLALLQPCIYVSVSPRFFYNRKRRFSKGKNNALNAGNYIGLRLKYNSQDIASSGLTSDAFVGTVHWGLQRSLGSKWSFTPRLLQVMDSIFQASSILFTLQLI